MVTEIMAREKCGSLAVPRTAPVQLTHYVYTKMRSQKVKSVLQYCWIFMCHVKCLEP